MEPIESLGGFRTHGRYTAYFRVVAAYQNAKTDGAGESSGGGGGKRAPCPEAGQKLAYLLAGFAG